MKIVIVVALYNPVLEELSNIYEYVRHSDVCILMDDSEIDNSIFVNSFFDNKDIENTIYVWNKKNVGLCASVNSGINRAVEHGADWVLLMNPDSKISSNMIKEFSVFIDKNDCTKICALAPQYNYDRHKRERYNGYRMLSWSNMSGMCVNVKLLEDIGNFDEKLFIDGLDIEWCIRARSKGYKIIEVGSAVLEHHPAETRILLVGGKELFKYGWDSIDRYYYSFRGCWYIFRQYKSFVALKWMMIKLAKVIILFDNKKEYLKMFFRGIKDANSGVWGIYSK